MEFKDGLPVVIVAGAAGRLGRKIIKRLLTTDAGAYIDLPLSGRPVDASYDTQGALPTRFRMILMDAKPKPADVSLTDTNGHEVEYIQCDFTKLDEKWTKRFSSGYVAFLLASTVQFPKASAEQSTESMKITSNLLEACAAGKVERVVLGSSTDVVRGVIEDKSDPANKLEADAAPQIGGKYELHGKTFDSTLYAATKIAGEAQAKAMVESGKLNRVVILRMGACYPLEEIIPKAKSGVNAQQSVTTEEAARGEVAPNENEEFLYNWFQDVHLRDEDLERMVDACVSPGLDATPSKLIYVNAVSKNPGNRLQVGNEDFGYVPPTTNVEEVGAKV
jgi:hypothetical protein